ncbi:MAG: hypothetical protein QM820_58140 [Minicystis sp.]
MFALVRAPAPPPASAEDVEAFSERVMEVIRTRRSGGVAGSGEPSGFEGAIEEEEDDGTFDGEEGDEAFDGEDAAFDGANEEEEAPAMVLAGPAASEATGAESAAGVAGGGVPRTALALDVPPELRALSNATPFVPEEKAPKRAPRTMQSEVSHFHAGKTTPVGDETLAKLVAACPLPFVGGSGGVGDEVGAGGGGGAAGEQRKVGAAGVEGAAEERGEGGLTLKEYASLLVELRSGRDQGLVLRRYRVEGDGVMERVVGYWEERMARAPEVRRQIEVAMEQYAAWLRGRGAG